MPTPVLVINSGSSSLKYQLIDADTLVASATGIIERIGLEGSILTHKNESGKNTSQQPLANHTEALGAMVEAFAANGQDLAQAGLVAVAHRVVHGGERFMAPVIVDEAVETAIEELSELAPLHNPANLEGIRVARKLFGDLPQVAIFDTAFHSTMPAQAYTYAVPAEWREKHGVRRYGFHGTSHAYVSRAAAQELGKPIEQTNVIVAHLGNGASITAVKGGTAIDTSMGLTPLEGLVMGTRSGDIDPAIIFHIHRQSGASFDEIDAALNKQSGMSALSGMVDMREIEDAAQSGHEAAVKALEIYQYRIRKYVGAYMAALGRTDAIVFTAGVGENSSVVRSGVLAGLETMGIILDKDANNTRGTTVISAPESPVTVLVIPTNEEGEIATQTADLLADRLNHLSWAIDKPVGDFHRSPACATTSDLVIVR